jgi:hypothetical protein
MITGDAFAKGISWQETNGILGCRRIASLPFTAVEARDIRCLLRDAAFRWERF